MDSNIYVNVCIDTYAQNKSSYYLNTCKIKEYIFVSFSLVGMNAVVVICGTHKISCVIYYPETIMHRVRYESIIN